LLFLHTACGKWFVKVVTDVFCLLILGIKRFYPMKKIRNIKLDETLSEIYLCENKSEQRQILLGASIPAGFPSDVSDYIEDCIDLNEYLISNPVSTFFFRVQGHSMEKFGVFDNDIVSTDRSIDCVSGKL